MSKRGVSGKNLVFLFSALLLVSFVLITLNLRRDRGPLFVESWFSTLFSPIQAVFMSGVHRVAETADHYLFMVDAAKENDRLKEELDRLLKEKNQLQETVLRQDRLLRLTGDRPGPQRPSVVATVIGRDATQWSKVVVIDKGTQHAVREKLPVITDAGVLGHIIESGPFTSKVLLITDSRSSVDALFQDSRVQGIVVGAGEKWCQMKYVAKSAEVKVGDRVVSSGLGGIFPKGIPIGWVTEVARSDQGLFQSIRLKPGADIERLEEVMILLP